MTEQHVQTNGETEKVVRLPKKQKETKREKFQRIARHRIRSISKALETLAALGRNQGSYEYSQRDVDKIIKRLSDDVEKVRIALVLRERRDPADIDFDD